MGMGVFYTHTTEGEAFRGLDSDQTYAQKLQQYYRPYHLAFEALVRDMLQTFGEVLIIDGHSYPEQPLASEQYATSARPEVDIGTYTVPHIHTRHALSDMAIRIFKQAGYSVGMDTPFKGSIVPTAFEGDTRVQTLMLEIRRDVYLCDEAYQRGEVRLDNQKLQHFHLTLQSFIRTLQFKKSSNEQE